MKNIEMKTAEGVAIEGAKSSLGENLNELASKAKEIALEKFNNLKDRAKAFAKENWAKISSKTTEWVNDIWEGINLKTVDKFKMAIAESSQNILIKHKERDIDREERKIGKIGGKIGKEEAGKEKAQEDYANLMKGAEGNPTLLAIIEKSKAGQVGKNDSRLDSFKTEIEERTKKKEAYSLDIENYKKNVETAKSNFVSKVDGRIENIKKRDNYENNIVRKETAEGSISRLGEIISTAEKELYQYDKVWEQRKILGKEAKKELKAKMVELKDLLKRSEKNLKVAEGLKAKYEKRIAKIEKRIGSLREFRGKYVGGEKNEVSTKEAGDSRDETKGAEEKETTSTEEAGTSGEINSEQKEEPEDIEGKEKFSEAIGMINTTILASENEIKILAKEHELTSYGLNHFIETMIRSIDRNIGNVSKDQAVILEEISKYLGDTLIKVDGDKEKTAQIGQDMITEVKQKMSKLIETK